MSLFAIFLASTTLIKLSSPSGFLRYIDQIVCCQQVSSNLTVKTRYSVSAVDLKQAFFRKIRVQSTQQRH